MASGGQWLGIGWAPWRTGEGGTSPPSNASLPPPLLPLPTDTDNVFAQTTARRCLCLLCFEPRSLQCRWWAASFSRVSWRVPWAAPENGGCWPCRPLGLLATPWSRATAREPMLRRQCVSTRASLGRWLVATNSRRATLSKGRLWSVYPIPRPCAQMFVGRPPRHEHAHFFWPVSPGPACPAGRSEGAASNRARWTAQRRRLRDFGGRWCVILRVGRPLQSGPCNRERGNRSQGAHSLTHGPSGSHCPS